MIQITNLSKKYDEQIILDNVNFKLPDSGLICLVGASGCGKSTFLNMLAGFDSDYIGEISVCGTSISGMSADELCDYRRNNIGFVFQNYNLLPGYTALENILLSHELSGIKEDIDLLLYRLNIHEKKNEKIENLSGGEKQRVAIARALMGNPQIILADEPTGALDRKNSTEIMELLKEISKERLVLVITHDEKICEFADKIISINNKKIIGEDIQSTFNSQQKLNESDIFNLSTFKLAFKNFKVHLKRYVAVSLAISIGVIAFMLSLSSGNLMKQSIVDFQSKNTAFNNGYIKIEDSNNRAFEILTADEGIENVYYQYRITDVTLTVSDKVEEMSEKYPMPKATESMSYGVMPKKDKNQIALSPSLAKKFDNNIKNLIGKELNLKYGGVEYKLTISGIFNAGYDDFFVSSDIEKEFFKGMDEEEAYSISYDVKNFEEIPLVSNRLKDKGIEAKTVANEVEVLQNTFENLSRLFLIVSILILVIGLFISVVLLVKLQNSRYKEMGLLSALGSNKSTIRKVIINENLLLSAMAEVFNIIFIGAIYLFSFIFKLDLIITGPEILLSIIGTGVIVIFISTFASNKLISTEPAVALRK
ncbi:MAG: ATP-binding cassette domain-containing protein [Clostridium sp.]|uniref:ABC transporter ATP-binding protein/permease n=1 Tax=Clostridium sp. TaxID=1506 RepID=UPI0029115092|nr:ATP-binding cassette domain-containing protein [Clostridium sp.]MDU5109299.1 ATP-binding cassette domain-containing protein [Clostridium sp.]